MYEIRRFSGKTDDGTDITGTVVRVHWLEVLAVTFAGTLWIHFLIEVWRHLGR